MSEKLPVFNIERFAIHDGAGIRTAVFLQGCQLRCQWCANPESQTIGAKLMFLEKKCVGCGTCVENCSRHAIAVRDGKAKIDRERCVCCGACERVCPNGAMQISGKWMTAEDIYRIVVRDVDYYRQTHGGVTFSGGEALLHIDTLILLLKACKAERIPVDFETCGHVPPENIEKALPWTECFLFDVKTINKKKFRQFTGGDLSLVLRNLEKIADADPGRVVIRVPVIPTFNHTEQDMQEIFELAAGKGIRKVDLLPYHTLGMTKYEQLGLSYPFSVTKSLSPDSLRSYAEKGLSMGLIVKIGG